MKTSKRFENAVTKLYKAFHNKTLEYGNCEKCAVGSIVGSRDWTIVVSCGNDSLTDYEKTISFCKSCCRHEETYTKSLNSIEKTGYSPREIFEIEVIFYESTKGKKSKQFDGLCAVVEYLCELDGISNVMDYTSLFETKNDKPVKELSF